MTHDIGLLPWPDEQPTLQDGDLVLRPWRNSDVDQVTAACQDDQIARFTRVPTPYQRADAAEFVAAGRGLWNDQRGISYAGVPADDDNRVLLSIGIVHVDVHDRIGEIGYWTAAEARGQGFTTRATRLLARTCLREWGFARIELLADAVNGASRGVARSAGFESEGMLRGRLLLRGQRRDAALFSLIPSDLQ
jgi:RimJ/RimL family protein N-acetyltransferase